MLNYLDIEKNFVELTVEFFEAVNPKKGNVLVLGCSTSEIAGGQIGKLITPEIADILIEVLCKKCKERGVYLAVQCCEHLNRALVVESETAEKFNLEIVAAVPKSKAGGSAAAAAYKHFENPVLIEFIKADYGIDIGNTFIGMHLKHVAVPVRLSKNTLGNATVTFATTRPKYIGGERAEYR